MNIDAEVVARIDFSNGRSAADAILMVGKVYEAEADAVVFDIDPDMEASGVKQLRALKSYCEGLEFPWSVFASNAEQIDLAKDLGARRIFFDAISLQSMTGRPSVVTLNGSGENPRDEIALYCKPGNDIGSLDLDDMTALRKFGKFGFCGHSTNISPSIAAAVLGASIVAHPVESGHDPFNRGNEHHLTPEEFGQMAKLIHEMSRINVKEEVA